MIHCCQVCGGEGGESFNQRKKEKKNDNNPGFIRSYNHVILSKQFLWLILSLDGGGF